MGAGFLPRHIAPRPPPPPRGARLDPQNQGPAAHARGAGLQVGERDLLAEQSALERLAAWALQFTSHVHVASSRALLLEVEGSLKIFRGLEPLREQIREGCMALGYSPVLAVAP